MNFLKERVPVRKHDGSLPKITCIRLIWLELTVVTCTCLSSIKGTFSQY